MEAVNESASSNSSINASYVIGGWSFSRPDLLMAPELGN